MPEFLVMTSGNTSGAPICRDDREAEAELSGFCDCMLSHDRDHLVAGHADACIGDGQAILHFVRRNPDFERQLGIPDGLVPRLALEETQLVQRVRGVGNELTQKNLPVGIQGVGEDIQNLTGFGTEFMIGGLFRHGNPPAKSWPGCARRSSPKNKFAC